MSKLTLNIDTDLDEQIQKCEELIKKYEELGDKNKQLHFVTIKEFAEMRRLFYSYCSKDFFFTGACNRGFSAKKRLYCLRH